MYALSGSLISGENYSACNGYASTSETNVLDRFLIREFTLALMLSYLHSELPKVVRACPLVSVTVGGDRYSVGYSPRIPSLEDRYWSFRPDMLICRRWS